MSTLIGNDDVRSVKTERALYTGMLLLLKSYTFKKITVKGICEQALISRAAFYAHFIDKYDLLEHWLRDYWTQHFCDTPTYEQLEKVINGNIYANRRVFKNLMHEADNETFEILFAFILSINRLTVERDGDDAAYRLNVVMSNFYAGGILTYISWQIKNDFPPDVPIMNRLFYELILEFKTLHGKKANAR